MRHLGNIGLFGLFVGLLLMPIIGFGYVEYQEKSNVLPAETVRTPSNFTPAVADEAHESTESSINKD
jgi:hypothetical protein